MYEAYTLSDQVWTPQLPAHWEFQRAKCIFDSPKEKNEGNKESNVLSLTLKGVIHNSKENPIGLSPADYATYQIFEANDLVFKLIDLENVSTSRVGIVPERGIMSSAYIRFSARKEINVRYFYYQYHDWWLRQIFNGLGAGVRQTLSAQDLLNLKLAVPPRKEQDQIVRYLDWQISRINHLIHGYQKQIKLLKERKSTLIDNAVTKGINPDTPMQHISGCWMGNIPAHWRMIPSKRVFVEGKERRREGDVSATASQKYGIISQEEYMRRENRRIVVANQGLDDWKHVEPGNLVISLRSFQGGIELCEITGCVTWHYIVLLPQEMVCTQYFKWLLKSKSYIKALQGTSEFIRDGQDLRYSNFVKVDLPLIPLEEQKAIAEYITTEVAEIDNALPVFQKEIELLREYRTRLISDVVTGQIDVRDVVVPEYTPEEDVEISTDEDEDVEEVVEDAE